jgi:hypothetical protein
MNSCAKVLVFFCICAGLSLVLNGCQSSTSGLSKTSSSAAITSSLSTSTQITSTTPANASTPMEAKILWSFLGAPQIGPVVDGKGNIYFGSYDQWLYSLTPSGEVRWKFAVPADAYNTTTSLVIDRDGLVYISTVSTLCALDNAGQLRWKLDAPKVDKVAPEIQALALDSDGTIYMASAVYGQGKVGLNAISSAGQVKWQYICAGSAANLGVGNNRTIYLGTRGGSLYAVKSDGTLAWELKPKGYSSVYGTPVVAADGTIYVQTEASALLLALSPDGVEKWRSDIAPNQQVTLGADGTIYVGAGASSWTYHSGLYALSTSGEIKWHYDLPGAGSQWDVVSTTAIVGNDGTIYFGSLAHGSPSTVYAVNKDGSTKWYHEVDDTVSGLTLGTNGVLYAGSEDCCVYAISTTEQEAIGVPNPPWNKPHASATGIMGWRLIMGSGGVNFEVKLTKTDFNSWVLVSPSGKKLYTTQLNVDVLDFPMGYTPAAGHYSLLDGVLPDAKEMMSLDFTGAKIAVVSIRGVGDYVYLEVTNTGDLPSVIGDVTVKIAGRSSYQSQFSTWGTWGTEVFPGLTAIVSAHYLDPRPGAPWVEGTPIDVTLSYMDYSSSAGGDVVLVEQQTTLGPQLFPRGK